MAKNIGILLDQNFDLQVKVRRDRNGLITHGLVVGDTLYQNQAIILKAQKGEIKEYPTTGVGIENMLNDTDLKLWRREITDQLESDGMQIDKLTLTDSELLLEAHYRK
jgi:hypothetical protein